MQICNLCKVAKPASEFHSNKARPNGLDCRCKECKRGKYKSKRDKNPIATYYVAKSSWCRARGIPFEVTQEYLESIWTGVCPVFGIKVALGGDGKGSHHSAHLDKFKPELGYVEGNVTWISGRANRIKYDASLSELKQLVAWMEGVTTS